jgi:hypothetical protein
MRYLSHAEQFLPAMADDAFIVLRQQPQLIMSFPVVAGVAMLGKML